MIEFLILLHYQQEATVLGALLAQWNTAIYLVHVSIFYKLISANLLSSNPRVIYFGISKNFNFKKIYSQFGEYAIVRLGLIKDINNNF